MADNHNYDGIKYRDETRSPLVFRILFSALVIWGIIFMGYYLFNGWSSSGEFETRKKLKAEQLAASGALKAGHQEGKKEDYIAAGKVEYDAKCAPCHGPGGKGSSIGPDLTNKNYKYGRTPAAITESISNGRPNGMPAYGKEISHEKTEGLVQYLLSL